MDKEGYPTSTEEAPEPIKAKTLEIITLLSKMEGHQAHHVVLNTCTELIGTLCDVESLGVCEELMMDFKQAVLIGRQQKGERDGAG